MAVAEGGFGVWAVRLQQASQAVHPEARWLAADVGGPLYAVSDMAASDVWGGPFADQLRGAIRYLDRELASWAEHLSRLHGALEQACWEAENAIRLEVVGVIPHFDVLGALAPWRRWPSPSPPLPADWSAGGSQSVGLVWVYPDRARQLAEGLRTTAEQVRSAGNRVSNALFPVGIDTPPFLEPVAAGLQDVADEIDRRVMLLEQVDRELAGAFRDLAAGLGFPGSLAPPKSFNPTDPIGSSLAALQAGPDAGPGHQPAQVKEADPVSTSTGNYLFEAIDLAQPARGLPTVFARTYNSLRAGTGGSLGFGWTHSLGTRLVADDGGITVVWGDGHEERHSAQGGTFIPPPGVHDRLRRIGDRFELVARAGVVYRFAADGRLEVLADRSSNASVLEYEEKRLVRLVDASGAVIGFEHDDNGRITAVAGVLDGRWVYSYSRAGDLVSVTDPEGGVTAYEYDDHLVVSITDAEGRRVVRNVYDGVGRVVEQRDGAGGRWRYRYEEGRTVVNDPLGHTKVFWFDQRYRTTAVTDANGATSRFTWDEASNLVAAEDATGRTFRFAYNSKGEVTVAEGPGSAPVRFEWDDEGNLTAIVSAEGHRAAFTWDSASRPVRIVSAGGITTGITWRDDGLPEAVSDGDGGATRYTFDDAGRLASITDPLGAVTTIEFDAAGRPVAERHPGGEGTTFSWDRCDQLVAVTDHTGATTRYDHDRCGRLTSITDPLGRITRYAYGPLGLLASVTDPLARETTFDYDPRGRLVGRTDARGETVSFSYDPAGRLVQIEASGAVPITYGWDAASRLVSMTDATGQSTWELDEAGRPTAEHRPDGIVLTHAYDTLGRRKRLELRRAHSDLGAWEYSFDPDGRITSVLDPLGKTSLLRYDATGRLASLRHPNGVTTTWAYDLAGQPIRLTHTGPDGTTVSGWTNSFDADGNLIRSEHHHADDPPAVESFGYDHLGRLVSTRNGNGSGTFSWDHASNRTAVGANGTLLSAGYDDADQLTSSGSRTYRHDEAGNLVERSGGEEVTLACAYDALGRVIELRADNDAVTFGYDGLGRRVTRTTSDGMTTRIFDGASLIAEVPADGTPRLETTAGLLVLHRQGPSGRSYLHADVNTNVSDVTNDAGDIVARFAYTPFGLRGVVHGDQEAAGPLGFCGALGVREEVGGLLDMRARLYDPALGRFTSPDPWPAYLPEPTTLNRYLYALGDPVSQVDPYGLFCWTGKNKHGKCRGLDDVVERGREMVGTAAPLLSTVGTVASAAAVVAAGASVVCPPCIPVTGPVAVGLKVVGTAASVVPALAVGATCIGEGVSFDCAVGLAGRAAMFPVRRLVDVVVPRYVLDEGLAGPIATFGKRLAGLFLKGTTSAGTMLRREK